MEIKYCPSTLAVGFACYSPAALRSLFGGAVVSPYLEFDFDKDVDRKIIADNVGRISVSGVQDKIGAVIENGVIRLTKPGERSTHILKPAPLDYTLIARRQIPANEHLTMQIASQVYGITTAQNGLCFDIKHRPVYITRRFDILRHGIKAKLEDMATLCQRNESTDGKYFKYSGSYEEIAIAILRFVEASPIAIDQFFRLVLFNYIYSNGDAHLKNFSIIYQDEERILAPAYDLLNTSLHLQSDDFALSGGLMISGWKSDTYTRTGHPCWVDFEKFGIQIGMAPRRVQSTLSSFSSFPVKALELIDRSFLDQKMKRKYIATVRERIARFCRHG